MKICVVHLENLSSCIVATSINKALQSKYKDVEIVWITGDDTAGQILRYSKQVNQVLKPRDISIPIECDILINLSPSFHPSDPLVSAKKTVGFGFSPRSSEFYGILFNNKETHMSEFQIYYRLAELKWKGQGYGLHYYPKTRERKNRAGIAISHPKLREYVENNLNLNGFKIVSLPYRRNIFKRMDEINSCEHIITEDRLTMHLSIYLRKYVHMLQTVPRSTRFEFFGNGHLYEVPTRFIV
jgi:ADP-heptose:LPS heptosyltransferase